MSSACVKFEMEKNFEQLIVIKFCTKFGFIVVEYFKMVKAVYGESAVSCTTVKHCYRPFREGRESFKDQAPSGWAVMTKTFE